MWLKLKENLLLLLFNLFNIIIFFNAYQNIGSINYLYFSLISLLIINYTFLNWKYYTELYFNIFLYLGFWFKFSLTISKSINKQIAETQRTLSDMAIKNNYSELLDLVSFSILIIFFSFLLIKKINFKKTFYISSLATLEYFIKKKEK